MKELETEGQTPPLPPMLSVSGSGTLDLEALMVKYLRLTERSLAPITLKYRKIVFQRFLEDCGNIPVETITTDHIEKYLLKKYTKNHFNKERTELMVLFGNGNLKMTPRGSRKLTPLIESF